MSREAIDYNDPLNMPLDLPERRDISSVLGDNESMREPSGMLKKNTTLTLQRGHHQASIHPDLYFALKIALEEFGVKETMEVLAALARAHSITITRDELTITKSP